jgi:hypothetical protein
MAKLVPPTPITLDRPRLLRCNFNAVAAIKAWTGKNLLLLTKERPDQNPIEDADPHGFRSVLAGLLLFEDPNMTPEKAGDLIDLAQGGYGELAEKMAEQINAYFGGGKPAEPNPTLESPAPSPSTT